MSLKPPKKSDLNKTWMKARRDSPRKIQPEMHLIVTEGERTEPAYFGAIRDVINSQYREKIRLEVIGEGENTLNLFWKARQYAERNPNGYCHVWVVFDTDDFPEDNVDKVAEFCKEYSTEETEYHAIWSNQCIELWYLLHFGFMQSNIHRTEYWPKLTAYLSAIGEGNYEKNRVDMYRILRPFMDIAIANARKLAEMNAGKTPSAAAPGTTVYELMEKMRPYL